MSWSRSGPPTCASRSTRSTAYLNEVVGLDLEPGRDRRPSRAGPRAGSPPCSWRRCRSRVVRTRPGSSPGSPGTTGTSSTTSSRRSSAASPTPYGRFLLETSILDRLSGALCDAVTGGSDGRAVLESLERSNLFVVPLDDSRQWYRYHHLFADVLRTHLLEERPGRDRRPAPPRPPSGTTPPGSRWPPSGTRSRPATSSMRPTSSSGRSSACCASGRRRRSAGWLDDIPDDVVRRRPVLAVGFIGALMSSGELRRRRATGWTTSSGCWPTRPRTWWCSRRPSSPGCQERSRPTGPPSRSIAGDPAGTVASRRPGDRREPRPETTSRSRPRSALSGLASWGSGDLEAAHRGYSVAVKGLDRAGNIADVLGCSITLGDLRITQGRLGDALRTYEDALRLAAAHEVDGPLRGTADMLVGLSQIAFERNDLAAARPITWRASKSWASASACRSIPTDGGSPARGCARPRGTWPARSTLLEEAERCTSATSPRTCNPSPLSGRGCSSRRGASTRPSTGHATQHLDPDDELATSASTSTSRWPGS